MPKTSKAVVPDTSIQPKYGRLKVAGEPVRLTEKSGTDAWYVPCKCECGTEKTIAWKSLKSGNTQSCGCIKREQTIEMTRSNYNPNAKTRDRIWQCWRAIIKRCYNPKYESYGNYGGRGIEMCPEWRKSFEAFREWATGASGYQPHLTIERIDVNGDYCPDNCTWITKAEQGLNRRNSRRYEYQGESKLVKQWATDPRCKAGAWATIVSRLIRGWSFEKALTTPSRRRPKETEQSSG